MARRRRGSKLVKLGLLAGAAWAGYLIWCCATGRSCCPFGRRPAVSTAPDPSRVGHWPNWGLRFTPWERDPGIFRPAYARLIQPDGVEIAVNGWADGQPDGELFFRRLAAALANKPIGRLIVGDWSAMTQTFRARIESVASPFVQGGRGGIDWVPTYRLESALA